MNAKQEAIGSAVLLFIAVGYLGYGLQYKMGTLAEPGAGLVPVIVGALMVALGVAIFLQSMARARAFSGEPSADGEQLRPRTAYAVMASLAAFPVLQGIIGYWISVAVILFLVLRIMGFRSWRACLALSLAGMVVSFVVFEKWMGIWFPRGLLG